VNRRWKNHDGFSSTHADHDAKVKGQCYEAEKEYKVSKVRQSS